MSQNSTPTLPRPLWVDTPRTLADMLERLRDQPALAVDTESNSLHAYQEQVCLIQISIPGADYLVDSLVLDDLSPLGAILADPTVEKVLHGADYDLIGLDRDFGFRVAGLFDTMWASRVLGWPKHSLAALLEEHFDIRLNKRYQRANWGLRPLPQDQLEYAVLDSHYLLPLRDLQMAELQQMRRWRQAQDRFRRLEETHWEPKPFDPEGFWQIRGARELDDAGRGVLRELYLYREAQAQAQDRPPFRVLSNAVMLRLSQARPSTKQALLEQKGITPLVLKRYGKGLLHAVRQGADQPLAWDDRPRNGPRVSGPRPSPDTEARYEALRAWRNRTADAREVEPDMVLPNGVLWVIARDNPDSLKALRNGGVLSAWQVDEFGADLLRVLDEQAD
jgi:ribonuclease D